MTVAKKQLDFNEVLSYLEKLNVNSSCPKCNSISIVKNGKKKRIQQMPLENR